MYFLYTLISCIWKYQHSESFTIWSTYIRINTEGKSLIMTSNPGNTYNTMLSCMLRSVHSYIMYISYSYIIISRHRGGEIESLAYSLQGQCKYAHASTHTCTRIDTYLHTRRHTLAHASTHTCTRVD
mgnify:CR=1 FL=1